MRFRLKTFLTRLCVLLVLLSTACTKKSEKPTVWIYTSIYKNVIETMKPKLTARFPNVDFQWYQAGSEDVAARLMAELASGKPQADLVLTSDPFWYLELKNKGHLLPVQSNAVSKLKSEFRDSEGYFATVRMCVAVIAYNKKVISEADAPKSWDQLLMPKWKNKVSSASPLQSGTAVSFVSQLVRKKGWPYVETLQKNGLLAAGGNSAVIQRMETQERPVGIVLLENVLEAQEKGSPLEPVYPQDGVILVPSPIAVLAKSKNPEISKQVYDYFFTDEMQEKILEGRMHSPLLLDKAPSHSKPLNQLLANSFEWENKILSELESQKDSIKKRFTELLAQ